MKHPLTTYATITLHVRLEAGTTPPASPAQIIDELGDLALDLSKQLGLGRPGAHLHSTGLMEVVPEVAIDADWIEAWRQPTAGEINFGEGAIHWRSFPRHLFYRKELPGCVRVIPGGKRVVEPKLKKWIKADDGLRYNNPNY